MSSRSQDANRMAQLAVQLERIAAFNVQLVNLTKEYNASFDILTARIENLDEANDDLDRRILALERG